MFPPNAQNAPQYITETEKQQQKRSGLVKAQWYYVMCIVLSCRVCLHLFLQSEHKINFHLAIIKCFLIKTDNDSVNTLLNFIWLMVKQVSVYIQRYLCGQTDEN